MIEFTFPTNFDEVISSKEHLMELLKNKNHEHAKFKCSAIKKYIYAKCKYKNCKAELRFKKN